jgi:hypothetical protein
MAEFRDMERVHADETGSRWSLLYVRSCFIAQLLPSFTLISLAVCLVRAGG